MMQNIISKIKDKVLDDSVLQRTKLIVVSESGNPVYWNNEVEDMQTLSVLSSNIHLAAIELWKNFSQYKEEVVLTLGHSGDGVYIFPLLGPSKLSIICMFKDELNPGRIKARLNILKKSLDHEIEYEKLETSENVFENISDHEIDNIFFNIRA